MWRDGAYIRVKWVNGRAVQEYIGSGVAGELAAAQDEAERAKRREEALAAEIAIEEWKTLETAVLGAMNSVRVLVGGVLVATGHHRRKRQWRKRRGD